MHNDESVPQFLVLKGVSDIVKKEGGSNKDDNIKTSFFGELTKEEVSDDDQEIVALVTRCVAKWFLEPDICVNRNSLVVKQSSLIFV